MEEYPALNHDVVELLPSMALKTDGSVVVFETFHELSSEEKIETDSDIKFQLPLYQATEWHYNKP